MLRHMSTSSRPLAIGLNGTMDRTVSEMAPSTQRDAEHLANRYGFASLAELAQSLPAGAEILDAGAGASPLGREVTQLRPDVRWTNFDYGYDDPLIRAELLPDSPPNLRYLAGDVRRLQDMFPAGTFDCVFSFWLLPHLSLADDAGAIAAAQAMFAVAKDGGEVFVGPIFSAAHSSDGREIAYGDAIRIVKDQDINTDEFAREAVRLTRLPIVARHLHRAINQVIFEQFGTSRYARGHGVHAQIFDPQAGEYVDKYTRRGIALMGQFIVAVAVRVITSDSHIRQNR